MDGHVRDFGHESVSEPMSEAGTDTDKRFFGTSDTDSDMDSGKAMTSDTDMGSDMDMSENLGHGFGHGHVFGHDFGHGETELHKMNFIFTNSYFRVSAP